MWHKKISFVYCASQFFYTQFLHYTLSACWSSSSSPGNKETFNPSSTHLSDIPKQLLSKSCFRKKVSISRFNVCKTSERSSYFSKVAGLFLANFAKINTVTGIFQEFYLGFKQFSIVCNISRRLSNGRFRKF